MKILIVSPYRTVAPHFENELEIAQRHLDRGHQVSFLSCLGELPVCDFNAKRNPAICHDCRLRRAHGMSQLEGRVKQHTLEGSNSGPCDSIPLTLSPKHFVNIETLKQSAVRNFDVGYATLSSLVSQVRDPDVDLSQHQASLAAFSSAALQVYRSLLQRFQRERPDRVYVFNGRFAAMRAVLRACQLVGVECLIHERGCDTRHFQLFRNRLPHDIDYIHQRMQHHWDRAAASPDRHHKASAWFHGRVQRVERNWHCFVKGQRRGSLPEGWNPSHHNLVVFTSSEDEFVAIGKSWSNRLYDDQGDAIHRFATQLAQTRPDAMLTVRMHPNLIGLDNQSIRRMRQMHLPNVRIIAPEAKVDTYQLMRVADTVVTFGSSIGIEAVYWSKPSVLLGPCFYQDLSGPCRALDHEHAIRLLSEDLMPATRHEALVYGYWQNTHGITFKYFEPDDDLFTGRFRGEVIYSKPEPAVVDFLSRQVASIRKRFRPHDERRAA